MVHSVCPLAVVGVVEGHNGESVLRDFSLRIVGGSPSDVQRMVCLLDQVNRARGIGQHFECVGDDVFAPRAETASLNSSCYLHFVLTARFEACRCRVPNHLLHFHPFVCAKQLVANLVCIVRAVGGIGRQPGDHPEVGSFLGNDQVLWRQRSVRLCSHNIQILGVRSYSHAVVGLDSDDIFGVGSESINGDSLLRSVGDLPLQLGPVVLSQDLVFVIDDVSVSLRAVDRLPLECEGAFECIGQLQVEWRGRGRLHFCGHFHGLFRTEFSCSGSDLDFIERVGQQTGDGVVEIFVIVDGDEVSAHIPRFLIRSGQSVLESIADVVADDRAALHERSQPGDVNFIRRERFGSQVPHRSRRALSSCERHLGGPGTGSHLVGGLQLDDPLLIRLCREGVFGLVSGHSNRLLRLVSFPVCDLHVQLIAHPGLLGRSSPRNADLVDGWRIKTNSLWGLSRRRALGSASDFRRRRADFVGLTDHSNSQIDDGVGGQTIHCPLIGDLRWIRRHSPRVLLPSASLNSVVDDESASLSVPVVPFNCDACGMFGDDSRGDSQRHEWSGVCGHDCGSASTDHLLRCSGHSHIVCGARTQIVNAILVSGSVDVERLRSVGVVHWSDDDSERSHPRFVLFAHIPRDVQASVRAARLRH
ncbi:hypothetical protein WR25_04595 [Diploscapter pachys]|uniref:Uncharacterized protein n=1 Tax=Diploscapter pachys TaxID=2018661 RepID=A0A2A2LKY5_9BILA|nr:hypothetical protein WR25_04595 [Diploscapter pachys]